MWNCVQGDNIKLYKQYLALMFELWDVCYEYIKTKCIQHDGVRLGKHNQHPIAHPGEQAMGCFYMSALVKDDNTYWEFCVVSCWYASRLCV